MGERVVGYWDCLSCNTKKILGTVRVCPNCGAPRQKGTKFYVGDAIPLEQVVKDKEEQAYIRRQTADWACEYCDCLNSSNVNICSRCGAPRSSDNHTTGIVNSGNKRQGRRTTGFGDSFQHSVRNTNIADNPYSQVEDGYDHKPIHRSSYITHPFNSGVLARLKMSPVRLIVIVAVLVVIGVIINLFVAKPWRKQIFVTQHAWVYEILLEEERTFSEEGWTLPAGARETGRSWNYHYSEQVIDHYETRTERKREIVGYEQVEDGYDYIDNGDGTFDKEVRYRQEPVYDWVTHEYKEPVYRNQDVFDWYYTYDIERWVPYNTVHTEGRDLNPYWGEYKIGHKQRVGAKNEYYYVYAYPAGQEGGTLQRYVVNHTDWRSIEDGTVVTCDIIGDRATLIANNVVTDN